MLVSLQVVFLLSFIHLSFAFLLFPSLAYQIAKNKPNSEELDNLFRAVQETLFEIISLANDTIDTACYHNLTEAFTCNVTDTCKTNDQAFYISKMIEDTSKNQNDLTTYSKCLQRPTKEAIFNISYVVVIIDRQEEPIDATNLTFISRWSIFGLCLPRICRESDIRRVIFKGAAIFWDLLQLRNETELTVHFINKDTYKIELSNYKFYCSLLPVLVILLQLIVIATGTLPCYLFNCCSKKAHNANVPLINENSLQTIKIEDKQYINKNSFQRLFNLADNGEELFNYQHTTESNNLSCLTYLAGIRGIAMLMSVFGFLYFALFNSASSIFFEKLFINMMQVPLFSIFYFGLRYSPKILLSCSGYSLFFKFICFLDEEFDELKEKQFFLLQKKITKEKKKKKNKKERRPNISEDNKKDNEENHHLLFSRSKEDHNASYNPNNSAFEKSNSDDNEDAFDDFTEKQYPNDIHLSYLVKFFLYQIHKYFLYVVMLCIMQYSLHYLFLLFKESNPMWNYFQREIIGLKDNTTHIDTLKAIGLLDPFLFGYGQEESIFKYCWFVLCEIKHFIVSTLLIFIGYKYQMRFDLFIIFLIVLFFIGKMVFFAYKFNNEKYFATLYYYFNNYGLINFSALWNYIYFLMGMIFGAINYVIQKDLCINEIFVTKKRYLVRAGFIVKYFKNMQRRGVFALGLLGISLIVLFSFTIPILLFALNRKAYDDHLITLQRSTVLNYFMLIDGEVIVLLVHFSAFLFYIKGDNSISSFLSHSIWFIFNKSYFSFILLLNPVILFVLYQSESRINLNIFNNILYSFTSLILIFVVSCVHYVCFELPWKRVIKTLVKRKIK